MALVSYSDSEDERPVPKRRRRSPTPADNDLPPLPSSFRDLYSSTARVSNSDDPSLHGGRKRAVPHVEGNWNVHVYLEWTPTAAETARLSSLLLVSQPRNKHQPTWELHSLLQDSLSVPLPLHISLSAPLVLRTETKDSFLEALSSALRAATKGTRSISVSPTELAWHANADRTRAFLVLRVTRPREDETALHRILEASNGVAEKFGRAKLYAGEASGKTRRTGLKSRADADGVRPVERSDAEEVAKSFHISLAWSLDVETVTVHDSLPKDPEMEALLRSIREMKIVFTEIKIRVGKDVNTIPFGRARDASRGILG